MQFYYHGKQRYKLEICNWWFTNIYEYIVWLNWIAQLLAHEGCETSIISWWLVTMKLKPHFMSWRVSSWMCAQHHVLFLLEFTLNPAYGCRQQSRAPWAPLSTRCPPLQWSARRAPLPSRRLSRYRMAAMRVDSKAHFRTQEILVQFRIQHTRIYVM